MTFWWEVAINNYWVITEPLNENWLSTGHYQSLDFDGCELAHNKK